MLTCLTTEKEKNMEFKKAGEKVKEENHIIFLFYLKKKESSDPVQRFVQ